MSTARDKGKSSGWTAFDLKQRQKQGLLPETENDPFPPIPNSLAVLHPCTNLTNCSDLSAKSFSSVLKPFGSFPTLKQNKDSIKPINMGKPIENDGDKVIGENSNEVALVMLKNLHSWAENSLIEDVLLATHFNIQEASALLKGMASASGTEKTKSNKSLIISDFPDNANCKTGSFLGNAADLVGDSSKVDVGEDNTKMLIDLHENKLLDPSNMKPLGKLTYIPFEPEWEEDDVYLSHRKDALRMMRSASQYSRAAASAFLRGDHHAAQKHSQNAQEEWSAAQRLNAKAAREILSIRNSDNDLWKLDLHGLHAAEAVQALHEHLRRLEMQVPADGSVFPKRVKANNGIVGCASVETVSSLDKHNKQQSSSRQRPTSLQVITGVGNHSRGQAALPAAVRSFLVENGYRFDEVRPGLIIVRPKFRHG